MRIITDRFTGRSRGFGYAQVATKDLTEIIDQLQGIIYKGRALKVNEALVDSPRSRPSNKKPYPDGNRGNQAGDNISNQRMYKYQPKDKFRTREHDAHGLNELSDEQYSSSNKSFF